MPKLADKNERIGEISYTNNGNYRMEIVDYINNRNVIVKFDDGSTKKVMYRSFKFGKVSFENRYNNEIFKCSNGGFCKIIKREKGNPNCLIEFDGIESHTGIVTYSNLKKGKVKNPWKPSVCGVGYHGKSNINSNSIAYNHWAHMISRCYDTKEKKYKFYGGNGVTVCDEWLNFSNYETWFNKSYYKIENVAMVVDKDILNKGNKIYNEENCIIIPQDINKLFCKAKLIRGDYPIGVGYSKQINRYTATITKNNKRLHIGTYDNPYDAFCAYKKEKEKYIKEMADKYKEYLPKKVYDALYSYEVEITD